MNAIDREAAADAIHKANMEALNTPGNWMAAGRSVGMTIAENIIRTMPAVEVEPVRHGKWIQVDEDAWECSACGVLWTFIDGGPEDNGARYCPKCGAELGEGKNKERICSVNGAPCNECKPGAPCAVQAREE